MNETNGERCNRCGAISSDEQKFCAECGFFLRDAWVDHRLLLALVHEREGRNEEAERELRRLLDVESDHVLANHLLGSLYFHQGLLDYAIARYEIALKGAPHFVQGFYDLGVAHYHRGNMIEAANAFKHCLELNPGYRAAHYRLGLSLFHAGRLDEALEHFREAMVLTPEYLMAHYHMGVIHERRGEIELAMREFEKSLEEGFGEASSLHHLTTLRRMQASRLPERHLERVNE